MLDQPLAEPPALEEAVIPLAAADAGLPEVTLENADLDAFVHALLASAERDRAMPVDTVPVLEPLHDELPAPALAVEHSLPAVDDDEPLDFAFDELLIAELDSPTDTPASQPPTLAALPEQDAGAGEVIVRYQGHTLGMGKWVGSRVKNTLPRELVRDNNLFV